MDFFSSEAALGYFFVVYVAAFFLQSHTGTFHSNLCVPCFGLHASLDPSFLVCVAAFLLPSFIGAPFSFYIGASFELVYVVYFSSNSPLGAFFGLKDFRVKRVKALKILALGEFTMEKESLLR